MSRLPELKNKLTYRRHGQTTCGQSVSRATKRNPVKEL